VVASTTQAEALLAAVARTRPDLAAFFGCLYYGALRPENAALSAVLHRPACAGSWSTAALAFALFGQSPPLVQSPA
jgi:hypothetical protein